MGDMTPNSEVDAAIELYNICKDFHVLPRAGGMLDQDGYHVMLFRFVSMAYNEKEANAAKPRGKGAR